MDRRRWLQTGLVGSLAVLGGTATLPALVYNKSRFTTPASFSDVIHVIRNDSHTDYFATMLAGCALWICDVFLSEDKILKSKMDKLNQIHNFNSSFQNYNWKEWKKILVN